MTGAVPRCSAHTSSGAPCKHRPMLGSNVCQTHGGMAPQVKAAATRRLEEARARASIQVILAQEMPDIEVVDPLRHLLEVIWVTALTERWLRAEIEDATKLVDYGVGGMRQEEHPLWSMWSKERDRLAKLSAAALAANVEDRQVRVLERQAEVIASVLRRIFDDPRLGLTAEQRTTVTVVAGEALRRIEAA